MRCTLLLALSLLVSCGPVPVEPAKPDPTKDQSYTQTVAKLAAMNREAETDFRQGKKDDAAKLIVDGGALARRVLDVPQPTTQAAEAASDLDDLYGRMLLSNRHYGDARLMFQKNVSRWRHWQPQTAETARRLKLATDEIAACDRHIVE